jgi:hypothetical protein
MVDDSITCYEMESFINSELMKTSHVEDESQTEDVKAQNDTKNNISECEFEFSFEVIKKNIGLSKIIIEPWEELQFDKN